MVLSHGNRKVTDTEEWVVAVKKNRAMLFPGGRLWKYGLKKGFNAVSKAYAAVPIAVWKIARLRIILVA